MILYAVFEANANKVSFDANGGTGSMPEQTIHTDEIAKLVANTFAKAGYTFVGWATAPDGKKVYNDTQSIDMGMESFTLYAVWEAKINTIRFDANGGIGETFSQDIATDETRALTKNTYTKNGYAFVGWATTPSGAIAYADQASYTMGTDASYTLYAVWKLADYSISYDLNGGVGDGNPTTYNMLSDSFTLYSPARPGYTFLGWSGTGIEGIGMTVTVETGSFGERSYTANWKANSNRIIFNANGGTGTMPEQAVDTDDTAALNANTFTNEGYVFAGWSTTPSGTILYADKAQYTMGTESTYALYAIWTLQEYSIQYELNNGTVSGNPTSYNIRSASFTLINPTRSGYIFLGWSGTGIDGMSKTVTIEVGSVDNRFYTANWESVFLFQYEANDDSYTLIGLVSESNVNLEVPSMYEGKPVKKIASHAFEKGTQIKTLFIPASIEVIEEGALFNCSSLENLTIPFVGNRENVSSTDLFQYPFGYLFGTNSYTAGIATEQSYFYDNLSSPKSTIYYVPDSLNIVTVTGGSILQGAFYNCTGLIRISIPEDITSIEKNAFRNCSSLKQITIPTDVKSINTGAFSGCKSLETIIIPGKVSVICDYSFANCSSLKSLIVPVSVETIQFCAFAGCSKVEAVYFMGSEELWKNISMAGSNNQMTEAPRYYYSNIEPTESGNYWHYDDAGNPIIWEGKG